MSRSSGDGATTSTTIGRYRQDVACVLGVPFRWLDWGGLFGAIDEAVEGGSGAYVCEVCASTLIEASRDVGLMTALRSADFNLPDGAPVAWAISAVTGLRQARMAGPSVMLEMLRHCEQRGYRVLLYGSTQDVLRRLRETIEMRHPHLAVVGTISPPFRPLSKAEDEDICRRVREAKADVIFVGLGCPRQEKWMYAHAAVLPSVLIGVGAAFEYNIGQIRRAPPWMQAAGLEWLMRLIQQPKRVGRRMGTTLPVFAWRLAVELAVKWLRGDLPKGDFDR